MRSAVAAICWGCGLLWLWSAGTAVCGLPRVRSLTSPWPFAAALVEAANANAGAPADRSSSNPSSSQAQDGNSTLGGEKKAAAKKLPRPHDGLSSAPKGGLSGLKGPAPMEEAPAPPGGGGNGEELDRVGGL